MPLQQFPDPEVQAKAEELGIVGPGQPVPKPMLNKVKAALVEERRAAAPKTPAADKARLAKSIVIQPGGPILVDGEPFPWLVARTAMDINLAPDTDGISTVRLTLLADSVQVLKPVSDSTESE